VNQPPDWFPAVIESISTGRARNKTPVTSLIRDVSIIARRLIVEVPIIVPLAGSYVTAGDGVVRAVADATRL